MPEFAVTAIGRDQPGIVAAISGALLELSGNVEDSQMSILRGHFAVMLIVRLPDPMDEAELEARLGRVRQELGLEAIAVNRVDDLGVAAARPSHVITVYGADHPGIVHAVSAALAGAWGEHHRPGDPARRRRRLAPLRDDHRGGRAGDLRARPGGGAQAVADESEVEVSMRPLAADAL